jgi:hypothetical protein
VKKALAVSNYKQYTQRWGIEQSSGHGIGKWKQARTTKNALHAMFV